MGSPVLFKSIFMMWSDSGLLQEYVIRRIVIARMAELNIFIIE